MKTIQIVGSRYSPESAHIQSLITSAPLAEQRVAALAAFNAASANLSDMTANDKNRPAAAVAVHNAHSLLRAITDKMG
jgi:hypothetical protein